MLSQKKVIVSTGTKNLQDQLFFRDLPVLLKALNLPIKVALLKGRQNYVCQYRIEYNQTNGLFPTPDLQKAFQLIRDNLARFNTGDRSELQQISEDSAAWSYATSTAENCLSNKCPYIKECFLAKARKSAQQADLVVINHHLFFADTALKEEGFAELLPETDVVIFDEAHQLPQVAFSFFGERLSSRQLSLLADDLSLEDVDIEQDDRVLLEFQHTLAQETEQLRECFNSPNGRYPWYLFSKQKKLQQHFNQLKQCLKEISEYLKQVTERSPVYATLLERTIAMVTFLDKALANDGVTDEQTIYWVELFNRSLIINATPLSIAEAFNSCLQTKTSYIFTSATLSVAGNFNYFNQNMGLSAIKSNTYQSPFDYTQQTMMYIPRQLPDPNHEDYTEQLVANAIPIIEAFAGRTFFLFTSFKALHKAEDKLRSETEFNLFVQGQMTKAELIEAFSQSDNAVLLGTQSFWEGVDVKGQALSCVIIDKLPFESPFEPVVQARIKALKRQGLVPFDEYQLPLAAISLKQGLGRLIRDHKDRGLLMVGDPRLSARAYGASFIQSLPAMHITRDRHLVLEFIKNIAFEKRHENSTCD